MPPSTGLTRVLCSAPGAWNGSVPPEASGQPRTWGDCLGCGEHRDQGGHSASWLLFLLPVAGRTRFPPGLPLNCPQPLPSGVLATCARLLLHWRWHLTFLGKGFLAQGAEGEKISRDGTGRPPRLKAECSFWTRGFLVPDARLPALPSSLVDFLLCQMGIIKPGALREGRAHQTSPAVPSFPLSC